MILPKKVIVPVVVFLISLSILANNYLSSGEFILRDIDLKGGTLVSVETDTQVDIGALERFLDERYESVFISGIKSVSGSGINIEVDENVDINQLIDEIKSYGVAVNSFSSESIGSFLGNLFFKQVVYILFVGFILMSIVIFLVYRNPVTSFGIVFATLANIIVTLSLTVLFGIKISFAGFAGLLMLIAYTVDTNIVLTHNVLKSSPENFKERFKRAFSTGVTLTATITLTMLVVFLLAPSKLLVNLSQILVIGFMFDLLYTWVFNSSLLEWWIKRRYR